MPRLLRLLLSRRIAVLAMGALAAVLLLASFVPEADPARVVSGSEAPWRAFLSEQLHPARLARSPAFLLLPGFIALSLVASMWQRVGAYLRHRRAGGPPPLERHVATWAADAPVSPPEAWVRLRRGLRAAGFQAGGPAGPPWGSRGAAGLWGSLAFHAGLVVVLVGTAASALGRASGELILAEQVPLELSASTLAAGLPDGPSGGLQGLRVTLSDLSTSWEGPTLTDVAGVVRIDQPGRGSRQEVARVNAPVWLGDFEATLHRYGFAVDLEAWDPSGSLRASGLGMVRALPLGAEDEVALQGGGTLRLRLYPDYVDRGGLPASRSPRPLQPVLAFRWVEGDRVLASGLVARGREATVEGYRLRFAGVRYWADFVLSRDPGLAWIALGALLCVAGLALRFTLAEQAWRASVEPRDGGSRVEVTLSARYHPASLEERLGRLERVVLGREGTP